MRYRLYFGATPRNFPQIESQTCSTSGGNGRWCAAQNKPLVATSSRAPTAGVSQSAYDALMWLSSR